MEKLRRAVRGVVGYNSAVYRAAAGMQNFVSVAGSEGAATWATLRRLAIRRPGGDSTPVDVKLRKLAHPIRLRPATDDATTVISTVVREEYGQLELSREPKVMIDAGAYIGDTSAYFLSRFKGLRIIALEPSRTTWNCAAANLAPYGERVVLLNKGLAATAGRLRFSGENTAASLGSEGDEIECTSVPDLMATYGLERIDILKMDIEGGETAIFKAAPERWLPRVDHVLIELHGPEAEQVVLGALRRAGFAIRQYRSVYYCSRTA